MNDVQFGIGLGEVLIVGEGRCEVEGLFVHHLLRHVPRVLSSVANLSRVDGGIVMETFNIVPDGHLVTYVTALGVSRNGQVIFPVFGSDTIKLDLGVLDACRVRRSASDLAVDLPILEELPVRGSSVRDVGLARRRVMEDDVVPRLKSVSTSNPLKSSMYELSNPSWTVPAFPLEL